MDWSPSLYEKFEAERNRPIRDLLDHIPRADVRRIVDLGCGPGNSTALLIERFPEAAVSGLDSSPGMLEAARRRLPGVRFEPSDIASWPELGPFDLLFANASLQWVPNHAVLLPFLLRKLAVGGVLAAQIPDNLDEPAHRLMREIAAKGTWSGKLLDALRERESRHSADWYYRELRKSSAEVDVWRTVYYHPLPGGIGDVVQWFQGTGLRPFLEPLDGQEKQQFLARYVELLEKEYPTQADGAVLLAFPRLFFIARVTQAISVA